MAARKFLVFKFQCIGCRAKYEKVFGTFDKSLGPWHECGRPTSTGMSVTLGVRNVTEAAARKIAGPEWVPA